MRSYPPETLVLRCVEGSRRPRGFLSLDELQESPNESSRRLTHSSVSLSLAELACRRNDFTRMSSCTPFFLRFPAGHGRALTSCGRRHAGYVQTSSPPPCRKRSVCVIRHPHNEREASLLSSVLRALCGLERARTTRCARDARALAEPNHACDKAATHREVWSVRTETALKVRGRRVDAPRECDTPPPKRECTAAAALP
jgi:hypothetical protein